MCVWLCVSDRWSHMTHCIVVQVMLANILDACFLYNASRVLGLLASAEVLAPVLAGWFDALPLIITDTSNKLAGAGISALLRLGPSGLPAALSVRGNTMRGGSGGGGGVCECNACVYCARADFDGCATTAGQPDSAAPSCPPTAAKAPPQYVAWRRQCWRGVLVRCACLRWGLTVGCALVCGR